MSDSAPSTDRARVAVLLSSDELEMLAAVQLPRESMTATFRRLLRERYRAQVTAATST
jgi:hypothetical protein